MKYLIILLLAIILSGCTTYIQEKDYQVVCLFRKIYKIHENDNAINVVTGMATTTITITVTTTIPVGEYVKDSCIQIPNTTYWRDFLPNKAEENTYWKIVN